MKSLTFSRRAAVLGAAALPVIRVLKAQSKPRAIVISSANRNNGGVNCCAKAMEMIKGGKDTLDAVIAGVNIVELDPSDPSVGYGGLPNEDGVVELDASCMHGPTRRGGAVGAIQGIKTPSKIAQLVLSETDHMMLVGAGALKFAKTYGFPEEDLLTDRSRLAYRMWKREMRDRNGHTNWESSVDAPPKADKMAELERAFPQYDRETLAWAYDVAIHPPHGTINCISLNEKGEMSAVTTTSGLAWKIAGRCGDSPIIGGGLWLDQDVGGCGSTGRGEENLRVCGAHTVVEYMKRGASPKEAILETLKRVSRNFNDDQKRLAQVDLNFYALRKDGEYAGGALWSGGRFAVCTGESASRTEESVYLYERPRG
ncbi:MAG TPA: N(4)-(beta-N-acetylglucosaminyl)-L-asparaginase [Bryobacteraceae bacterium]|nr:N(4)-(beta-N-acetylglucosaminyl)-L-asparaginase [Bryobacteraceae bacterium]